jgi:hypothetical protein
MILNLAKVFVNAIWFTRHDRPADDGVVFLYFDAARGDVRKMNLSQLRELLNDSQKQG